MNESPNKQAVIVGVFIFLGLVFLLAGILIIGNIRETFNTKMGVISIFDDVSGLKEGNNVWYSGVKIGTVKNMNFFGKSQVEVNLNISTTSQKYIRKDAKVKISTDGIIGNKILVIYGGTVDFAQVEEGDTLAVERMFTSEDMINTLQDNNENLLTITSNIKVITNRLVDGDGTIGKLMNDTSMYANLNAATMALQHATVKAEQMIGSLATFSSGLNKKGTLANELVSDTTIFNSVKASVVKFHQMADTASVFITNLKRAGSNPNSAIGVLLHDKEAGAYLKESMKNLESSSKKLDADLEAAQHNFLLRGYFKKKAKAEKDSIGK
ncbi:MAG TPA: MlaD family protein [Prolixibacteraceae bacterium]|nr:MlaD family protein [Prolixibacteraceae bacterium]